MRREEGREGGREGRSTYPALSTSLDLKEDMEGVGNPIQCISC